MTVSDFYPAHLEPQVRMCLDCAEESVRVGQGARARGHYLAARAVDTSPFSQIAYGAFLRLQGDWEAALRYLQDSWEWAKKLDCSSLRGAACRQMADLYRDLEQPGAALQYQQLAQRAVLEALRRGEIQEIGPEYRLSQALNVLLRREIPLARGELAILADRAGQPQVRGWAALHLAKLNLHRGDARGVHDRLHAARQEFRQAEDLFGVLSSWEVSGLAYCREAEWEEAQSCLDQALRIGEGLLHERRLHQLRAQLHHLDRARGLLSSNPEWN